MNRRTITTLLAIGGLATGAAAGYLIAGEKTTAQAPAANPTSLPAGARPRSAAKDRTDLHDLSRLIKLMRQRQEQGDPAVMREIERMSTAELRTMVVDLMTSIPPGLGEDRQKISKLIDAASNEWYRREGEEALRQVDAMPAGNTRKWMLSRLSSIAARTDPTVARTWVDRLKEEFGSDWLHQISSEAARGAASRSADEYLKVRELFKDGSTSLSFYGSSYPEDFDYRKVVLAVPPGYENSGVMTNWGTRNPEEAWETAQELIARHGKKAATYVTSIFQGISLVNDDSVAAGWLASKIGEVPPEHRREVFESMWSIEFLQQERVTAVMSALGKEDDKIDFAYALMSPNDERGYASIGLKALASDADREQVVLDFARRVAPGMGREDTPHYQKMSGYVDRTMEDAALPEDARERVRVALLRKK